MSRIIFLPTTVEIARVTHTTVLDAPMRDSLRMRWGDSVFVITRTMEVRKGLSLRNVIALGAQLFSWYYIIWTGR